jgi:hypothetical protein
MASPVEIAPMAYETVAAGQTGQVLGGTGAKGDVLSELIIIPATTSPGAVTLIDGATSTTVFTGGGSSVVTLEPLSVWFGCKSASGPWSITTGANVSVIAIGYFV